MSKVNNSKNLASLYHIAYNNTSDLLDIGIYGTYDNNKYTGIFRDATDGIWSTFKDLEDKPINTVNTEGTGYTLADIKTANLLQTGYIQFDNIVTPPNPGTGLGRLYKKANNNGLFWLPDLAGPEIDLSLGGGNVNGPNTAVNESIALFDGTSGKLIKSSLGILDTTGNLSGISSLNITGNQASNIMLVRNNFVGGDLLRMTNSLSTDLVKFTKDGSEELTVEFTLESSGNNGFYYNNGKLKLGDTATDNLTHTLNVATGDCNLNSGVYRIAGNPLELNDLNFVLLTSPVAGDIMQYNGSNWVNLPRSIVCDIWYQPVIETQLPIGVWTDIPLTNERVKDTGFTHTVDSPNITFNVTGRYSVTARCSTFITSGFTRSQTQMRLMLDTGAGFTQILGSIGYMYNKEVSEGFNTATVKILQTFSSTSIIKLQAITNVGSDNIRAASEGCSITIVNV